MYSRMNGYRGDFGYRGGWGRGPHPMFFFPALLLAGFVFFGLFKFLFPLIVLGFVFMGIRAMMRGGFGGHHGGFRGHGGFGGHHGMGRFQSGRQEFWNQRWNWENHWSDKRKNGWHDDESDEKPKRGDSDDSPRYARTANGDWVEIV